MTHFQIYWYDNRQGKSVHKRDILPDDEYRVYQNEANSSKMTLKI